MSNSKRRCALCKSYYPTDDVTPQGLQAFCKNCWEDRVKIRDTERSKPKRRTPSDDIAGDVRLLVKERDRHCRWDGAPGQHVHHIVYRSGVSGPAKHAPENLIFLCLECHALVHSNKRLYQPVLLKLVHLPAQTLGKTLLQHKTVRAES